MRPKKIMIVEDDAVTALNISRSMVDLDYEVSSIVDSGEKALEKVEETRPDLILMDIVLSGRMDGIEAAEIIRAKHNIPVIYLTAHSDKKTQKRAKASSPFGYILKPFKPKDLEVTIAMALHRHSVEKRMEHVYSVLEAMKKINQIGSRTRKPENFIKQVCEKLVSCTEYKKAWIILFDKDQKVTAFADAGYEEGINQMIREMDKGQFPECVKMALKKSTFIIESDKSSGCVSCKLWNTFEDKKALKARLKYGNILYGVLSITVEKDFLLEKKVLSVFNEVAGDIVDVLNRMKIEDQLGTSEARSRTIIENNVDGIVIIDDQGFIRFCNPAFGKLINKKEKELLGKHFGFPLVSEEATEIDIVGNNLTSIVAEMRTCLIEWEGKPAYLASIRDITERILAAEELEQSIERLDKVLVDTIHAMSTIVELRDPYTAGHQRRVANLASAIGKEIGLDKDQIIGLRLAGEIHDIGKIHIPAEI
ncbi:MAG: response regulator, partial [Candidatus Aminicenantes bacterium]|nr:response regulator [Candidatus Aminicenantes bacterium]